MTHARPLALLALAVTLAAACGHKGPPVAPLRRTPPSLTDFRFAQRGDALEVSCFAPRASVDGVAFESVDVEIFWAEGQVDLEKGGERRTVHAQPGAQIVERLPLPAPGTVVRAAARAVARGNQGQRTLILSLEAQPPLTPPHELTARLRDKGVTLNWQGPRPEPVEAPDLGPAGGVRLPFSEPLPTERTDPEAATPEAREAEAETLEGEAEAPVGEAERAPARDDETAGDEAEETPEEGAPRTHGFRVYRRVGSGAYGVPLNHEPQKKRIRTDKGAPVGATACYVVRAVASIEPLIESAPSNEACLAVRDVTPPAPPTGLAVVPREGGLEVVWSPSPSPDLGGYRIYRASAAGGAEEVGQVTAGETAWRDTSVEPGVLYRYSVTALDQAGNEGPPSGEAEGRPQ